MIRESREEHILFIQFYFFPDVSSVSQLLEELIVGLSGKKERRITVLCSKSKSAKDQKSLNSKYVFEYSNIELKRLYTIRSSKISNLIRLIDFFLFALQTFVHLIFSSSNYTRIIVLTSPPLIGWFVSVALLGKRKTLLYHYIQDLYPDLLYDLGYIKNSFIFRILRKINYLSYKNARGIITIGEKVKKVLSTFYLVPEKKIYVIENWDSKVTYFETPVSETFSFIYSGNCGLAHNFSSFYKLVQRLKAVGGIKYLFIGGGAKYKEVMQSLRKIGEKRICFQGYAPREQVGRNLSNADMLVLSQTKRTVGDILPSKFYSYLKAGRPLLFLGPKNSEIGEYIIENDIGIVLENWKKDGKAAVEYLHYLRNNREVAKSVGLRANRLYSNHMGFDCSLCKFEKILSA